MSCTSTGLISSVNSNNTRKTSNESSHFEYGPTASNEPAHQMTSDPFSNLGYVSTDWSRATFNGYKTNSLGKLRHKPCHR